jgi:hypothetical protein
VRVTILLTYQDPRMMSLFGTISQECRPPCPNIRCHLQMSACSSYTVHGSVRTFLDRGPDRTEPVGPGFGPLKGRTGPISTGPRSTCRLSGPQVRTRFGPVRTCSERQPDHSAVLLREDNKISVYSILRRKLRLRV